MAICSGTDINRSLLKAQLVQWVTIPSPFSIIPSLNISVTTHLRLAHLLIQYSLSQTSSFFNFFDGSRQGPLWLAAIASHDHNTIPPNSRDRDWLLVKKTRLTAAHTTFIWASTSQWNVGQAAYYVTTFSACRIYWLSNMTGIHSSNVDRSHHTLTKLFLESNTFSGYYWM